METTLTELLLPTEWEVPAADLVFSSDRVIEAYFKGKNDGMEEAQKLIAKQITENVSRTGKNTHTVVESIRSFGFTPVSAFLRIDSLENYSVLFIIPDEQFTDDKIISLYDKISNFESEVNNDDYNLTVSLCDGGEKVDESQIRLDGFFFKFKNL